MAKVVIEHTIDHRVFHVPTKVFVDDNQISGVIETKIDCSEGKTPVVTIKVLADELEVKTNALR